ncbi:similar to Saccharomyces cerevisiae YPL148C PPT2 Phosphopantetheine:protein transferase (PPTase), activates mitochondrial acyl carrier protein (Acp1p) by phosphopantetheinylation [Maudiozyma saulgeensis]|uniref:Similar to Saccharomyces cerevisiae YPL148C PPT2 Phosphopantetheine:protein transferase (PPTase), activates mitochondrial acyl carrier protein (Acp1p) by phosphopantetheinylation n=1 Tax=Maudiozyma saulgeensis TaxID=1789683 RepID=A0A1X7R945_9SACH|nr:similar to Saccharomyces cerevisiae YPL148C PPT2 Phosphopantetheine:protein transferase (PPTase), activates mitochondrial acyl carrier protein (Acp1p) by phosphopantetheinylation [Kazachstania saulgeensis]
MNNVLGIGTDIVYIPRIVGLLQRNHTVGDYRKLKRITNKFMTTVEQKKFFKLLNKSEHVELNKELINYTAGVWAAKESILKALSGYIPSTEAPPAQTIYSKLFTKSNTVSGAPMIQVEGLFPNICPTYKEFYNRYILDRIEVLLSMSHDHDYLISYCLIKSKH